MDSVIRIEEKSIYEKESQCLLSELNQILIEITGQDGTAGFSPEDVSKPRSCFMVAYLDDMAWGCGAIRQIDCDTAEVKRIYARTNRMGVGRMIMASLEMKAREFGYSKLLLSARIENKHALAFYESVGFSKIDRFGKYANNPYSCCFEKIIV